MTWFGTVVSIEVWALGGPVERRRLLLRQSSPQAQGSLDALSLHFAASPLPLHEVLDAACSLLTALAGARLLGPDSRAEPELTVVLMSPGDAGASPPTANWASYTSWASSGGEHLWPAAWLNRPPHPCSGQLRAAPLRVSGLPVQVSAHGVQACEQALVPYGSLLLSALDGGEPFVLLGLPRLEGAAPHVLSRMALPGCPHAGIRVAQQVGAHFLAARATALQAADPDPVFREVLLVAHPDQDCQPHLHLQREGAVLDTHPPVLREQWALN